jgi:endonuclease/exonuclease/phosphatase family metal-dependent hydrolase
MKKLKVLTYNIHKGFSAGNLNYALKNIKKSIQTVHADLVFLQEVIGHHDEHVNHMNDWPNSSQFEYLADQVWPHFAYGKNALYSEGHHGNAILSKYPIHFFENEDVSFSKIERRGLLHAEIRHDHHTVHAFCIHLGLFENDRNKQIKKLSHRIAKMVPPEASIIIAGDFNDWRQSATNLMKSELSLKEAFFEQSGKHANTFPSWFPCLSLDRVYYRNLKCVSTEVLKGELWKKQSDHLPIVVEFEFPESLDP